MKSYFLLWAFGKDRPGIVASLTKILFDAKCNLEDSSMMRLGSEFAIFLIFTSNPGQVGVLRSCLEKAATGHLGLAVGVKAISANLARFQKAPEDTTLVTLYGADRPGLVYELTACLAKHRFNISDLSTHRTTQGKSPGYVLFVEGNLPKKSPVKAMEKSLANLGKRLRCHIQAQSLPPKVI